MPGITAARNCGDARGYKKGPPMRTLPAAQCEGPATLSAQANKISLRIALVHFVTLPYRFG